MLNKYLASTFVLIAALFCTPVHASCGTTTCSINTNWDEHGRSQPGWSADLRYSYSRADTLRSGSKKITADTNADEVENLRTINKLVALGLDYTYDENWGVMLHVPYVMRDHSHNLGPYTGTTPAGYENFNASALGDIKVVGRYRWSQDTSNHSEMGVKLGLKLNTGKKDFEWTTGGIPGEASLQPGNGSTDLITGVFWHQAQHDSDWSWFAQGILQNPIKSSATFRPGKEINLDGGTRYALSSKLSGLLQLNVQWNSTDSGTSAALTEAGESSSGGRSLSLSPGLSHTIAPDMQLYGLIQLPLYQYVNGEQLTANSSVAIGVGYRF
ncbi:MAG: hypothetical protein Q7S51_09480 [Gallionellaceae bacterium]|nr:hypothetical protein [Gallionellaceae bacterium]